jgi:hypothetical protein
MKKTFNFIPVFAVLRLSSPNTPQTFFSRVGYSIFQPAEDFFAPFEPD